MDKCVKCGGLLARTEIPAGICYPCEIKLSARERDDLGRIKASRSILLAEQAKREEDEATNVLKIKAAILLTTETCPVGLNVVDRLAIVTAECVLGTNILFEFFTGIRDIVGGRSTEIQKVFSDARSTVLGELREQSFALGGSAVIGVSIQYIELSGKGTSMLMVVATGTAVVIGTQ